MKILKAKQKLFENIFLFNIKKENEHFSQD